MRQDQPTNEPILLSRVRNTLICLEDDPADAVLSERSVYYFPTLKTAHAVLRSTGRMQFVTANPGGTLPPEEARAARDDGSDDGVAAATDETTLGSSSTPLRRRLDG